MATALSLLRSSDLFTSAKSSLDRLSSQARLDGKWHVAHLTREQLRARVRAELAGLDLVSELLADRRAAAAAEDAA